MSGAVCTECQHQHVGADHGGVCIGCPCSVRSAAWLRDLATCTACGHIHSSEAMGGICIGCACDRIVP